MAVKLTATDRLLKLARRQPILRVKDLLAAGIHPEHLRRLHQQGVMERASRGVYRLADAEHTEHLSLAEVAKRVPHGVVCLLSALLFHGMGTQLPPDVWLAVERRAARPASMNPKLRVVRLSLTSILINTFCFLSTVFYLPVYYQLGLGISAASSGTLLAPVLIAGWGTGRPLGVMGAGLASTIAVLAAVIMMLVYFLRLEHFVGFDAKQLKFHLGAWKRILKVGLPAGGEFALMFVFMGVVYAIIRDVGASAQAGFGIGGRVMQSLFLPAMAVAFAAAPIAGQCIGAGNVARARQVFWVAAGLESLLMVVLTIVAQFEGDTLVRIFTQDPEIVAVGAGYLAVISFNFVAQGVIFTASGMFQALGNTVPAMISSATRVITFAGPGWWLHKQPGFTLRQLWLLSVGAVTLQMFVSVGLLAREYRKKAS